MTNQQMEALVERIVQRLRPPVLVMVTAAAGYRHAIRQRLAGCGESLHLALDSGIDDGEQWQSIGKTLPAADWQYGLPSAAYKALLLPFLDYPLAADLVNGSLHSPFARRVHDALLSGLPVLALRYHCDPASELNQLRGAQPDTAYAGHMQATLSRGRMRRHAVHHERIAGEAGVGSRSNGGAGERSAPLSHCHRRGE